MTDEHTDDTSDEIEGSFTEREDGDGIRYDPPEAKRRTVVNWLAAAAGGVSIGAIGIGSLWGISSAGLANVGRGSNIYVKGTHLVDKKGNRIKTDALKPGSSPEEHVLALPELKKGKPLETKDAVTLLLRYKQNEFEKPTNIEGTAKGYVAYSMVCTHAGCLVEGHSNGHLHCPCHGSLYEGTAGAKVVGGPAPRPIPQLPIAVSNKGDLLVATGDFEGPVGTA